MVTELAQLVEDFPGEATRSCCFAHILNLSARSVIRPFDSPKNKAKQATTEAEKALEELSKNLEVEEALSRYVGDDDVASDSDGDGEGDGGGDRDQEEKELEAVVDDEVDGWVDKMEAMTADEVDEWDEASVPVRLALVKVSHDITAEIERLANQVTRSSSCASSHTLLRTPRLSSCPNGLQSSRISTSRSAKCLATSPRAGTRHSTCSISHCNTGRQS